MIVKSNKIIDYLANRGELIILSVLTSVTFALYNNWPIKVLDDNLSANLLAGAIWSLALAITVGYIIRRNEMARTLNARYAMYADCCLVVNQFASMWADIIKACTVTSTRPKLGEDLLSEKFVRVVSSNLDISKSSQMFGDPKWGFVIQEKVFSIQKQIDKILDTYISVADPAIIKPIKDFKESPTINILAQTMKFCDIQTKNGTRYQKSLPIAETFVDDLKNYKTICQLLAQQMENFRDFGDIIEPFDLNWDTFIELVDRIDLLPQLGSAVRPFPTSADASIVRVGRGAPPVQPGRTGRKRL